MTMESRLPEYLELFGRRYRIQPMPAVHVTEGVIGMAAYSEGTIYIDADVDLPLALSTVWHEAVHIAQIDLHGQPCEEAARWISLLAHSLLVHNPEIVQAYLDILPDRTSTKPSRKSSK